MQITDSIADMRTRIRNAGAAHHETVDVPASNVKKTIANILLEEGYISGVETLEGNVQGIIRITLKYHDRTPAISGLRRISRPGLRIYSNAAEMPQVLDGLGIAIVSTSKGLMTDRKSRQNGVGGEVMAYVW